jgi:hypothetical protein
MLQQLQDAGLMQQLPDMLWDAADAVNLATAPDTREPNVLLQHRQQQHDLHQQHQHQQQPVFCSVCQRLADTECMQQAASVESSAKEVVLDLESAFSALRGVPAALLEVPQLQQLVSSPDLVPFLVLQLAVVSQGLLVQQPLQELRAAAAAEDASSRRGEQQQQQQRCQSCFGTGRGLG